MLRGPAGADIRRAHLREHIAERLLEGSYDDVTRVMRTSHEGPRVGSPSRHREPVSGDPRELTASAEQGIFSYDERAGR